MYCEVEMVKLSSRWEISFPSSFHALMRHSSGCRENICRSAATRDHREVFMHETFWRMRRTASTRILSSSGDQDFCSSRKEF